MSASFVTLRFAILICVVLPAGIVRAEILGEPGDTDLDTDVDSYDLSIVYANWTGTGPLGKTWYDGDFDCDGDVDEADRAAGLAHWAETMFAPPDLAGHPDDRPTFADLLYNPTSGNLSIDAREIPADPAQGSILLAYVLASDTGPFVESAYTPTFLKALFTATANEISIVDVVLAGASGVLNLGNILPVGLDPTEWAGLLSHATYVGPLGSGLKNFDLLIRPAGDADADRDVDDLDIQVVFANFTGVQTVPPMFNLSIFQGDFDGDGDVDDSDLAQVFGNFGTGPPARLVRLQSIPEPQAIWLAIVGLLAVGSQRLPVTRRRKLSAE